MARGQTARWRPDPFHFERMEPATSQKELLAFKETANERLFLIKDLATVEEAVGLGAKIVEAEKIKSQLFP